MIKYSLYCDRGHEFESWFASSDTYDTQVKRGLVDCPMCGSTKISKALMAPSVATSRKKAARREAAQQAMAQSAATAARGGPPMPSPPSGSASAAVALLDDEHRKLRQSIQELHNKIAANTVDVGDKFSEEARKMHDGEAPERAIRGQASLKQAKELWDDGIPVLPVPALPDDKN